MRHTLRLACCVALVVLFFTGAFVLFPFLPTGHGPDEEYEWDAPADFFDEIWRGWELDERCRCDETYESAQRHIFGELAAGRLSLADAARHLCELPDPPENFWEQIRHGFGGGDGPRAHVPESHQAGGWKGNSATS
jgi:hypothetical protein